MFAMSSIYNFTFFYFAIFIFFKIQPLSFYLEFSFLSWVQFTCLYFVIFFIALNTIYKFVTWIFFLCHKSNLHVSILKSFYCLEYKLHLSDILLCWSFCFVCCIDFGFRFCLWSLLLPNQKRFFLYRVVHEKDSERFINKLAVRFSLQLAVSN